MFTKRGAYTNRMLLIINALPTQNAFVRLLWRDAHKKYGIAGRGHYDNHGKWTNGQKPQLFQDKSL